MKTELVVYAMLINWIATTIFVESTLFAPLRDKAFRLGVRIVLADGTVLPPSGAIPEGVSREQVQSGRIERKWWAEKLAQLVTCIMCLGTWVAFAEALYFGGPLHGWAAPVANGLLYKAGGHLIYELRSRVAK